MDPTNCGKFEPGHEGTFCGRPLRLEKLLGKGKSGYSWLATHCKSNDKYVLKQIHQEPCPYYQFSGDKLAVEIDAYERLCALQVPVPRLLGYDSEAQILLKEYIDGPVASKVIAQGNVTLEMVRELASMAEHLATNGLNADFFPANFVVSRDGRLFYIDYEINPFMEEWSLENWGIFYWANFEGMAQFCETGDSAVLNRDPSKGYPHRDGEIAVRVARWFENLADSRQGCGGNH